jgi:hypothetical protein
MSFKTKKLQCLLLTCHFISPSPLTLSLLTLFLIFFPFTTFLISIREALDLSSLIEVLAQVFFFNPHYSSLPVIPNLSLSELHFQAVFVEILELIRNR